MKPNLALLTISRRIAAAILAMWKHEEVYDPTKHSPQAHEARRPGDFSASAG